MRLDFNIRRQYERQTLPGVRKIDVLSTRGLGPCDPEHIAKRQESVGADQNAAGPEKSIFGKTPDHAKVTGENVRTTKRDGRTGECGQSTGCPGNGLAFD